MRVALPQLMNYGLCLGHAYEADDLRRFSSSLLCLRSFMSRRYQSEGFAGRTGGDVRDGGLRADS